MPTYASYGASFLYTAANWVGGTGIAFEVYMRATAGIAYARLFNETDGVAVAGSTLSTTSGTYVRLRSGDVTAQLVDGKTYRAQLGKDGADGGEALTAALVATYG